MIMAKTYVNAIVYGKSPPKCSGCGELIDEHCAHMSVGPFGVVHVKEQCLVIVVSMIRSIEKDWDWNAKSNIKVEGRSNADVQDEGQRDREVQEEES